VAHGDTTTLVRGTAADRGVSERTVWRWFAAVRAGAATIELLTEARYCDYCGNPLPEDSSLSRRFCDANCRVYNHRYS
jgi:transcriptional regulator of met regulon